MPTVSSIDVSQTLLSPGLCQSRLSVDTCSTSSTVWSPQSVQTFSDSMDMDTDCGPSSTLSNFGSRLSLREHSSVDAARNLDSAYQQIHALPPSEDRQLLMEVFGE